MVLDDTADSTWGGNLSSNKLSIIFLDSIYITSTYKYSHIVKLPTLHKFQKYRFLKEYSDPFSVLTVLQIFLTIIELQR